MANVNKLVNSQLTSFKTYHMYRRQMLTLAENVFPFKNLNKFIDKAYLNKTLVRKGSVAFFVDEVMGLLASDYTNLGVLDFYGRPTKIEVMGQNGYRRKLNSDEFVIMYDNNGMYPIFLDVIQYAERMAYATRTIDINIAQQKTPRFWKASDENYKTVKDTVNNVDAFSETVIKYNDLDFNDTNIVLSPAPFVADKVKQSKDDIWNEFLRLIGIANMNYQKKERNIKDEILTSQGGTVASRYSRYEPRQLAVEEINNKFSNILLLDGTPAIKEKIEVGYYDGIPSTPDFEDKEDFKFESEVDNDDI